MMKPAQFLHPVWEPPKLRKPGARFSIDLVGLENDGGTAKTSSPERGANAIVKRASSDPDGALEGAKPESSEQFAQARKISSRCHRGDGAGGGASSCGRSATPPSAMRQRSFSRGTSSSDMI